LPSVVNEKGCQVIGATPLPYNYSSTSMKKLFGDDIFNSGNIELFYRNIIK
jgi:hypothetical protein